MRKFILCLSVALMAMAVNLKAQTIVIDDGFENGILDSIWSQEYVAGQTPWAVESLDENLAYPSTVVQGSKRLYLRNTTGETQGYKTRLVSRVMDLSEVYQPFLSFYYANPKWTADRDTLRVLYRTGTNKAWQELITISDAHANWTKVNQVLPEYNKTYQIAFEGTDNLGRGIVLDSVKLRSTPECTVPHDLAVNGKGNGKATLTWQASWDAEAFDVVITTVAIDPDTLAQIPDSVAEKIIAVKEQVSGFQQQLDLNLQAGGYFYVYVRSVCEAENSDWSKQFYFRMASSAYLPYEEKFNMPYNAGFVSRGYLTSTWTWGNNTGNFNPFVATHINETECAKYSPDATAHLVFTGANSSTAPIPGGQYVYCATPAIVDSLDKSVTLRDCQVSFWSTVATYTGRGTAHSLIVGAMSDPTDLTTFVAIDTVQVYGSSEFVENVVDFANAPEGAQYVAFLSNFDKPNNFYIDNLLIEKRPALQKVTKISVNPRDSYADITWEGNAASYRVLVLSEDVPANKAKAENTVLDKVVSAKSLRVDGLEADHSWNRPYYVLVQAVAANGDVAEWSYRKPFVTIAAQPSWPMIFNMEQSSGAYYFETNASTLYPKNIGIFSNDPEYPHLYTTNPHAGLSTLYLSKDWGNDSYITFPAVENITETQLTFWLSGSTTPAQARAVAGVMTNPMDISTFVPVQEFAVSAAGYVRCYTNFKNYKGDGNIIAIVWADLNEVKNTIVYIDDVTIEEISSCVPPVGINVAVEPTAATITWPKGDINRWQFVFTNDKLDASELEGDLSGNKKVILMKDIELTGTDTAAIVALEGLTEVTSYYYYVRTLCGSESTATASWWAEGAFRTDCSPLKSVPFFDNFDSYEGTDFGCWYPSNWGTATTYPKTATSTYAYEGNSVELYSTSTTQRCLFVAPKIDCPMEDLLVTFMGRSWSASAESRLIVGTIASPLDTASFVGVDTIYFHANEGWKLCGVGFAGYKGSNEYVAFTTGFQEDITFVIDGAVKTTSDFVMDNVKFQSVRCAQPYGLQQIAAEEDSISFSWQGLSEDKWEIVGLKKYVTLSDLDSVLAVDKTNVLYHDSIPGSVHEIGFAGLELFTKYYVYVRPTCGVREWNVDSVMTACLRINPRVVNKITFEDVPSGTSYNANCVPACWTLANAQSTSTTYAPYVYKSTTYASSGENSLRLYSATSAAPTWAAAPEIQTDNLAGCIVTFNQYVSTSYYYLFGVMTDPTDINTFVVLDSVKGSAAKKVMQYDLADYEDKIGNAKYIAWRTRYGAADYIYLDDISVIESSCPTPKPSLSGATYSSVRVASGLRVDSPWELLVTTKEQVLDSLASATYVVPADVIAYHDTITTRNKLVTGLEEETEYYFYLKTVCEDGSGLWASTSLRTPCKPVTPEAMGTIRFSKADGYVSGSGAARYLPCWTVGNKTPGVSATSTYIPYVYTTATYLHNKDSVLCLYSYVTSTSSNDGAYAIMPELNVDDIAKYQVNFYARAYNSTSAYANKVIVGIITDATDLSTFVAMDTLDLNKNEYEGFSVSFEDYMGDAEGNKGRRIMFLNEFGVTNYAFIASISVTKIPACREPKDVVCDSVAENSAFLSWKGYSDLYRVLVADRALKDEEKETYEYLIDSIVSTSDSVEIKGLEPGTSYTCYVKGFCGTEWSAVSMSGANFTTECPEIQGYPIPYFNNFDNERATGGGNRPLCWLGVYHNSKTGAFTKTSYPYVLATASKAFGGTGYSLETMSSKSTPYETYIVAPKVQGDLNTMMVSLNVASYSSTADQRRLYVGYVTKWDCDSDVVTSYVMLDSINVPVSTTNYGFFEIDLAGRNIPAGARITLHANATRNGLSSVDILMDNFKIGFPPTCYAPTIAVEGTTLTSATVKITPYSESNSKWELAYISDAEYAKLADQKKWAESDSVQYVTVTDTIATISGLKNGTTYQVFARTLCGGDDGESEWTIAPLKVRTQYYYADTYFFGMEKEEGWERAYGSTSDSYYAHPSWQQGYYGGTSTSTSYSYLPHAAENSTTYYYSRSGKGSLKLYNYSTYYGGYVILPMLSDCHSARSFSFAARAGYESVSTRKMSTVYTDAIFEVGTVENGKGMETYEKLAFIQMPNLSTSDTCNYDKNNAYFSKFYFDLPEEIAANRQMVIRMIPQYTSTATYVYIDNIYMNPAKGWGSVFFKSVKATSATAVLAEWENLGGPWNLTVFDAEDNKVAEFKNLTTTSKEITGLTPQTTYKFVLASAKTATDKFATVTDTRVIKTPCLPLEPNAKGEFVFNFDDVADYEMLNAPIRLETAADSLFVIPGCWSVATTYSTPKSFPYYSWYITQKWGEGAQKKGNSPTMTSSTAPSTSYGHYEYGRNNTNALKIYGTSTYKTGYVIMPELNCSFDTMMVELWMRCIYNYDATHATASYQNKIASSYASSTYNTKLVVATIEDPNDLSTITPIDTVQYVLPTGVTTSTLVTADPAGERYWQKFQLPLAKAKGKQIVFYPADGSKTSLIFLDDVAVKAVGDNIFTPSAPQVDSVGVNGAAISWTVQHPSLPSVVVRMDLNNIENHRDTLVGTSLVWDDLQSGESYQWYIYQISADGSKQSSFSKIVVFRTDCESVAPDYKTGFELEDGWYKDPAATSDTYKVTKCWTYGNAGTTTAWSSSFPYNYASTGTAGYGHSGAYAPRIYAYSTTYQSYLASPALDVNAYDTLQVNFWIRPGYHNPTTGKISTQYTTGSTAATAEYYYAHTVIVGTMTDPNDATTFVPIDTITYRGELLKDADANVANNFLYQKYSVSLVGAKGAYVAFMASLYMKGDDRKGTYDYMWIDDVEFTKVQECEAPMVLTTSNITKNSAVLNWEANENADTFYVEVATDLDFETIVYADTVAGNSAVVNSLASATTYIWRVRSLCGDLGDSEFSQNAAFNTLRTPFYLEDFRETALDGEWSFATNPITSVLDATNVELTGANNTSYGWRRTTTTYGGATGAHYYATFYSSSTTTTYTYDHYWMVSPVIALDEEKDAQLSVKLALSKSSTTTAADAPADPAQNIADDFLFVIVISDDAGKTWKTENVLAAWSEGSNNKLSSIPYDAATYRMDLTKYKGKNIRVGFYRMAETYLSNAAAIHISNLRVNYYENVTAEQTLCQFEDINELGFEINGDEITPGQHTYRRSVLVSEADAQKNVADTTFTLVANYNLVPQTLIEDTICEGETYSGFDFMSRSKAGVYKRKLQSAEACDSIVTLVLSVTPRKFAPEDENSICPGETFTWNGKTYDRPGVYRDTTISSLFCDSVMTLVLRYYGVEDTIREQTTIAANELPFTYNARQYATGQKPIFYPAGTAAGTYVDTVNVIGENCATVMVHTLIVYPATGIDNVDADKDGWRKVIIDNHIYINRKDKWFDVTGKAVSRKKE